ncbi:1081_t:CDS:2 [Rhizophagus irregularis]|nr:1081_t:CDS:2 [Rhizophagus irregularis]
MVELKIPTAESVKKLRNIVQNHATVSGNDPVREMNRKLTSAK